MAATLHPVTPFVPAGPDIQAAIDFYTRVLGFAVRWNAGDYVCVDGGLMAKGSWV